MGQLIGWDRAAIEAVVLDSRIAWSAREGFSTLGRSGRTFTSNADRIRDLLVEGGSAIDDGPLGATVGDFDVGSAGVVNWGVVELGATPAPSAVGAADVGVVEGGVPAEGALGAASPLLSLIHI